MWSCGPQSHRREPKASPVRHEEWSLVSTPSFPDTSPLTTAMWSLWSLLLANPSILKLAVEGRELRHPDEAYAEVLGAVLAVPVEAAGPVLPDVVVEYLEVGIV